MFGSYNCIFCSNISVLPRLFLSMGYIINPLDFLLPDYIGLENVGAVSEF